MKWRKIGNESVTDILISQESVTREIQVGQGLLVLEVWILKRTDSSGLSTTWREMSQGIGNSTQLIFFFHNIFIARTDSDLNVYLIAWNKIFGISCFAGLQQATLIASIATRIMTMTTLMKRIMFLWQYLDPEVLFFIYILALFSFGTCNSITGTDITWKITTNLCVLQIEKFKANSDMSFLF